MPYALEILCLEICFVILVPRLEKEQKPCSAGGFMMVSSFQVFQSWMGVAIWVSLLTSRAPSSSSHGVGLVSRGKNIHQAAKEGNLGAVRHFLRVDPESLERKDEGFFRRSLGAEVGNFGEDEWSGDPRLP